VVYQGMQDWNEPTSLRDKVDAEGALRDFVPDMRVILVDLGQIRSSFLPELPELEARIRTMQLARQAELAFESMVAIFALLQSWEKNHSQNDALNDIIICLGSVLDAKHLRQLTQAFKHSQTPTAGKNMPNCLEALFEQGVEQGRELGREQGRELGREEGREEGREQGREQGRELGLVKGIQIGRIQLMQQLLDQPVTPEPDLRSQSLDELQALAAQLEVTVRRH